MQKKHLQMCLISFLVSCTNTFASETEWEKVDLTTTGDFHENCDYKVTVYNPDKEESTTLDPLSIDSWVIKLPGIDSESMYVVSNEKNILYRQLTKRVMGLPLLREDVPEDMLKEYDDRMEIYGTFMVEGGISPARINKYLKDFESKLRSLYLIESYEVESLEKLCR